MSNRPVVHWSPSGLVGSKALCGATLERQPRPGHKLTCSECRDTIALLRQEVAPDFTYTPLEF